MLSKSYDFINAVSPLHSTHWSAEKRAGRLSSFSSRCVEGNMLNLFKCAHFQVNVGFIKGNCTLTGVCSFKNLNNFWHMLLFSFMHIATFCLDSLHKWEPCKISCLMWSLFPRDWRLKWRAWFSAESVMARLFYIFSGQHRHCAAISMYFKKEKSVLLNQTIRGIELQFL